MERTPNWAAQFFLVLFPAAVGCLLGALILEPSGGTESFAVASVTVALVFAVGGAGIPVLTIKKPLRAYRFLFGIGRSPLSRQAALVGLTILLLLLHWILVLAGVHALWLGIVTAVIGACAVLAAGLVYMPAAQRGWSHWSTPQALFCGLLTLGVSTSALVALGWRDTLLADTSGALVNRILVLVGVAGLAVAMGGRSAYLGRGGAGMAEARAVAEDESRSFRLGAMLLTIGGIATAVSFASDWTLVVAFVALLAALFVHWRLFFLTAAPLSWKSEVRWLESSIVTGKGR